MGTSDTVVYDTQRDICFQSIFSLGPTRPPRNLFNVEYLNRPAGLRINAKLGAKVLRKWLRAQKTFDDYDYARGFGCFCEIGWSALYMYPSGSKHAVHINASTGYCNCMKARLFTIVCRATSESKAYS